MKKFLLRVLFFAVYAFLLQVVFPVVVDPFNVFHVENMRANGVEANKNYSKMKYILDNPDRFDSFLFGSSRVGAIHTEKIPDMKTYNMTYSLGTPSEHLGNIKTFVSNNVKMSKIYVGLDSFSYMEDPESHLTQPLRCPYEYLRDHPEHFYSLYLNPMDTLLSLKITLAKYIRAGANKGANQGKKPFIMEWRPKLRAFDIEPALNDIKGIVNICRENKIELVLFTNPIYYHVYMKSCEKNYLDFLEGLVKISDFYNFSSLNDITLNSENYADWSHYKPEIGDMILNVICSNEIYPELYKQGFGVKVTRDNAEEFIAMLKRQAADYAGKAEKIIE